MKWLKLLLVSLAIVPFLGLSRAHADVNDFIIHDFHGRYELFNDVNGGRMHVTETIELTFSAQNHGILRAIPVDYQGNSLKLDVKSVLRDGQSEPYTTYNQGNHKVLKIGDAKGIITGRHTYKIQYEMQNIITFFNEYDEWYWDINGDQWQQAFEKVSGEVVMPENWDNQGLPAASCYTGFEGSTQLVCGMDRTERGYIFSAGRQLNRGETLTVATAVQKGLFVPRDRADWFRDNVWQFAGLFAGAALSIVALRQWWLWGKDHKGRGVIVPEYKPPKNLTPAEVGLLHDYNVDSRDLTATIIDLAVRGYVKIHDEEKKTLGIFKSRKFSLELTNEKIGNLKAHEKSLLQAIFATMSKGTRQELSGISRSSMQTSVMNIRSQLKTSLTKEYGLLEEAPTRLYVTLGAIVAAAVIMIIVSGGGWGWSLGSIAAIVCSVISMILMRRRSHAGVAAYEHIQGLKLYMDTAEKERLKMMQSVDRPYAEPSHTVELFEKLLPYAVALGVEKSWSKQFESIYRESPNWYAGNHAAFSTVYFTNSLASGVTAFNSSFSASTSSSSSGSGGGGFAGGGGGGGGGGGW